MRLDLDGAAIQGHPLGLKIAAGNVPSFVDLATGGWGEAIQGPLNSSQTPTMANFATIASVLAGCVTLIQENACEKLFAAAMPPKGNTPTDTLTAAEAKDIGLVTRVVADDELQQEALALARQLAAGAPAALANTKRLLWSGIGQGVEAVMPEENHTQAVLSGMSDALEGLAAVIEKRAPRFTGC